MWATEHANPDPFGLAIAQLCSPGQVINLYEPPFSHLWSRNAVLDQGL